MKNRALAIGTGVVVLLSCWTARNETTNLALTFHIVSKEKLANGRFIDTPAVPKLGYVSDSPDLTVTSIQDVAVQKMGDRSIMFDTNGTARLVPHRPLPSLGVYLHPEDGKRFSALTGRALNKQLLVMFGGQPLTAARVVAPIETGSFVIGFQSEADLKKTQDDLKKLIR